MRKAVRPSPLSRDPSVPSEIDPTLVVESPNGSLGPMHAILCIGCWVAAEPTLLKIRHLKSHGID